MAGIVKTIKKCFYKYINSNRRANRDLHPFLDMAGKTTKEDEKKAEVLNAFFNIIFILDQLSTGYSAPELEEQNEVPTLQKEAWSSTCTVTSLWDQMESTKGC